jgi:hypothetical protein
VACQQLLRGDVSAGRFRANLLACLDGLTGDAQNHFDPLWGMVDPGPGEWFPAQALKLALIDAGSRRSEGGK